MEITKNVILDLMPLYITDEVSEDTRALIEKYLKTDPELAEMAKRSAAAELPGDIPIPLTREEKLKVYIEAKRLMILRTFIKAAVVVFIVLSVLVTLAMSMLAWTRFTN